MTHQNWVDFKAHLNDFKSFDIWTSDEHAEALSCHLLNGISKFVPKSSFTQKQLDIPWNSAIVRRTLRKKNRLYKCYRSVSSQYNLLRPEDPNFVQMQVRVSQSYEKFKNASKSYKFQSRRAKNSYFNSLKGIWSNPGIPAKKKFSLLQKLTKTAKSNCIPPLIEGGKVINDPFEQAEIFNKYFTGKSNVINPNDKPPDLETFVTNNAFDTLDTTHWELGPIIKSLKSSNHSPCGIPATFIKDAYTSTGSTRPSALGMSDPERTIDL